MESQGFLNKRRALPGRVTFGAFIIKEWLGVTDEETVAQVRENPCLQYFLGYHQMLEEAPFDPSMMGKLQH